LIHNSSDHYHGNIHGNLISYQKPRWILMDDNDEDEEIYPSPESMQNNPMYIKDWKSDIFQFAFVIYTFMVCKVPWVNLTLKEIALKIDKGDRPEWVGTITAIPPNFLQLINICWHQNPMVRPNCSKILNLLQEFAKSKAAPNIPMVSDVPYCREDSDSDDEEQNKNYQRYSLLPSSRRE